MPLKIVVALDPADIARLTNNITSAVAQQISEQVTHVEKSVMADFTLVTDAINALAAADVALGTSIDTAVAKIADLAQQIIDLSPTGSAISALADQINSVTANLTADKVKADAAVAPPAGPLVGARKR